VNLAESTLGGAGSELEPGARIAHYRLDERLGTGGMGDVFRAEDLALNRPAAVKVIRAGLEPMLTRRLIREVDMCARLQHRGIATFYEGGEEHGRVYFAMELVDGATLRLRLNDGPLPPVEALTIAAGLLEALAHAHLAGILHRDVKPENIILTREGTPKLLDFGLASRLNEAVFDVDPESVDATTMTTLTKLDDIVGTPGYMSPEQLRGQLLGAASDVFQIGAVLFEMITGRRAFSGGSPLARIAATLAGAPDLTSLATIGPIGLDSVLRRALSVTPADRFQSAGDFLLAIDAVLEGRARPNSPDSVAITAFQNQSGDPANDWIASGLAESLGADLDRVDGLRIASRTQTALVVAGLRGDGKPADPAETALGMGAQWAIGGCCQRAGDRLRVIWSLVDAATGALSASGKIDGTVEGLFDLEDQLAREVAGALKVDRPSSTESPASTYARAFELHAKARAIWNSGGRDPRMLAMIEEAISLAPDYAPALATLVSIVATRFIESGDPADLHRAIANSDRVIAIDPTNAEAWSWRGYALSRLERYDEAAGALRRAIAVGGSDPRPHYLYGSMSSSLNRPEEALPHLQRAVQLEPRMGIAWLSLGWAFWSLGQYTEARYAYGRAKALEGQPGPTNLVAGVGGYLAECLRCEGRLTEARAEAMAGLESIERSDHRYRDTIRALCLGALGRVALRQGDTGAAAVAFTQAIAQLRGRTRTLGGGHAFVQALGGLVQATGDRSAFDEATRVFDSQAGYSFKFFFGCVDAVTLLELARAAQTLGDNGRASALFARAQVTGARQPLEWV
jgi:eukaryotic-like serine/threonine-protein kinase